MKRGTQIIYVPSHADGNVTHPDCQAGFVTSLRNDFAFCRYWSKHHPGELRTRANSEATPFDYLVVQATHSQNDVDQLLEQIEKDEQCRLEKLDRKKNELCNNGS